MPGPSRLWLLLLALTLALLIVAVTLVFGFRDDGQQSPPLTLDLGAVVAANERSLGTVNVRLSPATIGSNVVEIEVQPEGGSELERIERVSVSFVPYAANQQTISLMTELSRSPRKGNSTIFLEGSSMWEARVSGESAGGINELARFVFLLPDPNLHGHESVPMADIDPIAEQLYQRASTGVSELHRVTYEQQLSDGDGLAVLSYHAVNHGQDGTSPGFTYLNPGGLEAVVLGETAWSRSPGEPWDVRETNSMIPPSKWGGEYAGATGFQLGPITGAPAGPCRIVTFVVPEVANRSVAWYAWCIDESSGALFRDAMISRSHYMVTDFDDFNEDVLIMPPLTASGANPDSSPSAGAGR